jgi:predicted nuclease of predicted toxin-antitoxin system
VRYLPDSDLSHRVAVALRAGGLQSEHVRDHVLQVEPDEVIPGFAREHGLVVVSEDTDFGELLARLRATAPSFVLLGTSGPMPPEEHAALLLSGARGARGWRCRCDRSRSHSSPCSAFASFASPATGQLTVVA